MATDLHAKPVIENRFWIVEHQGEKIATLRKDQTSNQFVLSAKLGVTTFNTVNDIKAHFGEDFFVATIEKESDDAVELAVHGFPTKCKPVNPTYDVVRALPMFKKKKDSSTVYCAGYYVIKFDFGWVTSFCPKLSTVLENEYKGPFKSKIEMNKVKSNESSNSRKR